MVFTVDEDRKQSWNVGWWRRQRTGKAFVAMAAFWAAVGIAALTYDLATGMFGVFANTAYGFWEQFKAIICVSAVPGCLGVSVALVANIASRSRFPSRVKSESLVIEDGVLTYRYRIVRSTPPGEVHVMRAYLGECFWYWEPESEQVVIWTEGGHLGAMRAGDVPEALAGDADDSVLLFAGSFIIYPWFEPDLIAELKRTGVPERQLSGWRRFLNRS